MLGSEDDELRLALVSDVCALDAGPQFREVPTALLLGSQSSPNLFEDDILIFLVRSISREAGDVVLRREPVTPLVKIQLVTAGAAAIFTLIGLSEPRAYLYLTPMFSALTAIGVVHSIRSSPRLGAAAYAALIVASVFVLSNLRSSDTPFKRNAVIPFSNVVDFVKTNQRGKTVLLTSDVTVFYSLAGAPGICAARFEQWSSHSNDTACVPSNPNDTVIVVKGLR